MRTFLITFEFNRPLNKYELFHETLSSYEDSTHIARNIFLIKTRSIATLIRDNLSVFIGSDDKLFVIEISGEFATSGFDFNVQSWINK